VNNNSKTIQEQRQRRNTDEKASEIRTARRSQHPNQQQPEHPR
jgi:hypothetical protein